MFSKFTLAFPIAGGRLVPYITGGGGVGYLAEHVSNLNPRLPDELVRFEQPDASKMSEIRRSLMVGGGIDVRVWRELTVGVDARWLQLHPNSTNRDTLNTAQVATRVR
jgi:opacity protein-like surface antigen